MLKFLTHKLRTHSLNEDNVSEKVEERDSGTESDDEADRDPGDLGSDIVMKWADATDISMCGSACACACAPPPPPPDTDQLYDHHSSEEELEVINGAPGGGAEGAGGAGLVPGGESRRRGASSPPPAAPEKRKWPARSYADVEVRPPSSDDDDTKVETPVRFRTSPPREALKPRCPGGVGGVGSAPRAPSPPAARRRRLPLHPPRRHRPALDFDKMQQLKVGGGGVRSWRAVGGAHGGELSVFCW